MLATNTFFTLFILGSAACQNYNRYTGIRNWRINKINENEKDLNGAYSRYYNQESENSEEELELQRSHETTETKEDVLKNVNCPIGQSLYVANDLKDVINYIVDLKLKPIELINSSYYLPAIAVRDKYMKRLKEFQNKLEDRPEHLKHILEDLAKTREEIGTIVEKVIVKVEAYHENKDIYYNKIDKVNKTLENVEKIKKICKLNCEDQHLFENSNLRRQLKKEGAKNIFVVNDVQNYCSTFEDVRGNIIQKFSDFQSVYVQTLEEKIANDDELYEEKTKNLTTKLKEAAVKKFGITMYDILSLQDEYYHLSQQLSNNNVSEALSYIQKTSYLIEIKLTNVKDQLDRYREYCMNCKQISFMRRKHRQALPKRARAVLLKDEINEFKNILDDLINSKIAEITNIIEENYADIFKELNEKLNNTGPIDIYLAELTPVQDDIANMVEVEYQNLDRLKGSIPKSSFDDVNELQIKLTQIIDKLTFEELLHIP